MMSQLFSLVTNSVIGISYFLSIKLEDTGQIATVYVETEKKNCVRYAIYHKFPLLNDIIN